MTTRKPDRRIERTKMMLSDALIDLILEKGYDKISVQNIVDRANIGRTTFYAHFEDKEALLTFSLGNIEQVVQHFDNLESFLENVLIHATENPRLFHAFLKTETLRDRLTYWFVSALQLHHPAYSPAKAQFVTGGIIALLRWWQLEAPQHTFEEILEIIQAQIDYDQLN